MCGYKQLPPKYYQALIKEFTFCFFVFQVCQGKNNKNVWLFKRQKKFVNSKWEKKINVILGEDAYIDDKDAKMDTLGINMK